MKKLAYIFGIALFLFGCAGQFPQMSTAEKITIHFENLQKAKERVYS